MSHRGVVAGALLVGSIISSLAGSDPETLADPALLTDEEINAKYRAMTPQESDFTFSPPAKWGPNIALRGKLTSVRPAVEGVEKAVDGQPATTWTAHDERGDAELVLDLGEIRRFDRLVVFNRQTDQRGTAGGNNAVKRIALSGSSDESPVEFRVIGGYDLDGPFPMCFKRKAGGQVCAFIDRSEPTIVELPVTGARYVKVELEEAFWAAEANPEWRTSIAVSEIMLFDSRGGE